jgi:hypothetical protein
MRVIQRLGFLTVVFIGLTMAGSAPASARSNQLSGSAVVDFTCPAAPAGYDDFPPLQMSGSLEGCWYTDILTQHDNGAPSGVYLETGREIFVGTLDGQDGTFATTYRFESKWVPDITGSEVKGRCQHVIAVGSGTGVFAGASGRVDFKDVVANGSFVYRGHISLP